MKQKESKKIYWTTALAVFVFVIFVFTLTINLFRQELFGIVPRSAGSNFGFNITFFIPMTFLILIGCIIVIIGTLFNWKKRPRTKDKLLPLLLTLPIIWLFVFQIFSILRN